MLIGRPCRAIAVALSGPALAAVPVAPTPIGVAAVPWEEARRGARTGWREARAMSTRDDDPLHAAIDARLASLVANCPTPPAWAGPWRRLGPESSDEERLAVYRAIRSSGSLPEDAGLYLVSWQIDALAGRHAEQALHHLDDQLEAIERAHGLDEGEAWEPGEAPPEYAAVLRRYHDAWDEIFAEKLEQYGEADMARLFREDPEEFRRRSEAGRLFFHEPRRPGSEVPAWLDELVEAVADCLTADGPMGPLGFRYGEEEGFWELVVYPTPVELLGGAHDGAVVAPGFTLDLEGLRAAFDRVDDFGWNAPGLHDADGPHVWVEGEYRGREVWLRVLAQCPRTRTRG